jgi:hypothetical protein
MKSKLDSAIYRPDLGTAVMEYNEDGPPLGFIGLECMPIFNTAVQAGSYPVIPKEALLKLNETSRAPRSTYARDDWEYERGTFQTAEKGKEELLDDSERSLFDQEAQGMADFMAVERCWNDIMRGQEKRIADMLFNTTNFTNTGAVSTEWDTAATATPIDDVNDANYNLVRQCGMSASALIISWKVWLQLRETDQIVDRLKYTFPGIDINTMSTAQMAAAFGIPRVLVGGGVYDNTGKGIDTTITDLWNDEYAMLCVISSGMDLRRPGIGRTFLWTADSPQNPIVEEYRDNERRSDVFRVRHHVSEALIASRDDTASATIVSNISAACAYLLSNIHT